MKIKVRGLNVRSILDRAFNRKDSIDLRYDVQVKFSPEDLQNIARYRGVKTEEMIDLIGEGIKSEMRRLHEMNKTE